MDATGTKPSPTNRIPGFDIARALAIFGMVLVNFKVAMNADTNGPPWLVNFAGLFDGRAAATFVVLAGVGISLLSQKARTLGDPVLLRRERRSLWIRALILFVVGMAYTPLWPADILHFYGVYIAIAAFLITVPSKWLWAGAVFLVAAFCLLFSLIDYELGWEWSTLTYLDFWTPAGFTRNLFYNGFHPVAPWLAFLLLGLILGRQDFANPSVRRKVFLWGAGVALCAEILSRVLVHRFSEGASEEELEGIKAVFGAEPMPPLPLYVFAGAGTACAVIALCVAIGSRWGQSPWLRPIIATGQLAFTLYLAHVIIGMGTLSVMGRLKDQTLPFAVIAAAIFCLASILFATLWRRKFQRGPLESLMALATRRRKPPA